MIKWVSRSPGIGLAEKVCPPLKAPLHATHRSAAAALMAVLLSASAVWGWQQHATVARSAAALAPAEREASSRLSRETIREVTSKLASREMEGRGAGTPGGEAAARFLASRFAKLRLKPRGDGGTYLQAIKFRSSEVLAESSIRTAEEVLKYGEDFVIAPPAHGDVLEASGNLVFASYGVVSDELNRDDLSSVDVTGKIVVILRGRPRGAEETAWEKAAARQAVIDRLFTKGAVGVVLTNFSTQEQPYALLADYFTRRSVAFPTTSPPAAKARPVILASDRGAGKLFLGSGLSFADARQSAEAGEFAARDLNKLATINVRIKHEEVTGSNVVAELEGSDPRLKEQAVVYSAHYDAFGVGRNGRIYAGAADNALGVGMMVGLAEALAKTRPRRSMIFLAVTGEEHGLLGAEYWVNHPTWPLEKIAANLNFDGIGTETYGEVRRIVGFGSEFSELGDALDMAARATGNAVAPDPLPEEQAFFRSDHFAFVKKGIPALMLIGAPEGDQELLIARAKKWLETDYHQTTDVVRVDWNWEGPRRLAIVGLVLGMRLANADDMPQWRTTAPFKRRSGGHAISPTS